MQRNEHLLRQIPASGVPVGEMAVFVGQDGLKLALGHAGHHTQTHDQATLAETAKLAQQLPRS
jgi:acyl-[acyl carrier protein]--UDP-N-acetylglucosamine O-acyltransferase